MKIAFASGIMLGVQSSHALPVRGLDHPAIISTEAWDAKPPTSPPTILQRKPLGIVIHHTASPNSENYSREFALNFARGVQQGHFDVDWLDSGHHFLLTRGGYILEGRHGSLAAAQSGTHFVVGTHTTRLNDVLLGIESQGNYDTESPPQAMLDSLIELCAWLCQQYDLNPANIWGHFNFASTLCPGLTYYHLLPDVRAAVLQRLHDNPRPQLPILQRGDWQPSVQAVQYLLKHHGYSVVASGMYDQATADAVSQFQAAHGIAPTGQIDAQTWQTLFVEINQGDQNHAVSALQILVGVPVTGTFDQATANSLGASRVNGEVWERLLLGR
ncbi:MAG: N-acetylmuramoyl-L-alanine amidase [Herpetosiphon sp.]|nr:N-acetylmuramoyl-L-alanine amidase [Herpetosiphon sp.]